MLLQRYFDVSQSPDIAALEARTASDQKVVIKTKRISDKSTEVGIRVGLVGDESKSRQILDRMQANYPALR